MTQNTTKRALVMSMISLILCVSMLAGSTFAWFTDTASTGVNKIVSGNLDVGLLYSTDFNTWADAEGNTDIFSDSKWEPGYTEVVYFEVENKGSLVFKYKIGTNLIENILGKTEGGSDIDLTKFIKFGIVENVTGAFENREAAITAVTDPLDFKTFYSAEKELEGGESAKFAMVAWMPESVGNDANHNGTDIPSVEFGVKVYATQKTSEEDSFGPDYDAGAELPVVHYDNATLEMGDDTSGKHIIGSGTSTIVNAYTINGNIVENFVINAGVSIVGAASQVTGENVFENCVFIAGTESCSFWVDNIAENATVTFNNCHFDGALKLGGDATNKYIFNNCTFEGKAGWPYGLITAYTNTVLNSCSFEYADGVKYSVYKAVGLSTDVIEVTGTTEVIVAGKATTSSPIVTELKTAESTTPVTVASTQEELDNATEATVCLGNGTFSISNVEGKTIIGNGNSVIDNNYKTNNVTVENCIVTYAPAKAASGSRVSGEVNYIDCTFVGGAGKASFWSDSVSADAKVTFEGCEFESMVKLGGGSGVAYSFKDCKFSGPYNWKYMVAYADVTLDGCEFENGLVVRGNGTPTLTLINTNVNYENFASVIK